MKSRLGRSAAYLAPLLLLGLLGGRPRLASAEAQSAAEAEKRTSPPLVVRLSVDLVQLDAVVTDAKGHPVTDLRAADFEIVQDGRVQAVTQAVYMGGTAPSSGAGATVSSGTDAAPPEAPADALVFVVDDLALSVSSVEATRRALWRFADGMDTEGSVFLLRTSGRIVDLQPVGGPAELRAAARALRPRELHLERRATGSPLDGQAQATNAYLNSLLARRALLSLQDITDALRAWRGRKTLVLFSEGFPVRNPREEQLGGPLDQVYGHGEEVLDAVDRLTDLANRASVVIHTLDPRGLSSAGISAADSTSFASPAEFSALLQDRHAALHASQASLAYLAERTGGLAVANNNDVGAGVASILSGSRGYYLVGYEPGRATFGGGRPRFHNLQVRVKRHGLKVRSRKGFFGVSDEALPDAPSSTPPADPSPETPPRRQVRSVQVR
jgi:VWFA-related protein